MVLFDHGIVLCWISRGFFEREGRRYADGESMFVECAHILGCVGGGAFESRYERELSVILPLGIVVVRI